MQTLLAALFAAAIALFFVRGYLKKLTASQSGGVSDRGGADAPVSLRPCPRCNRSIPRGLAFCGHCGAAMAMWKVHSASIRVQGSTNGAKGKLQPVNASVCVGLGQSLELLGVQVLC